MGQLQSDIANEHRLPSMAFISELILELHEAAAHTPLPAFQSWALQRLAQSLDFDAAYWASGTAAAAASWYSASRYEHRLASFQPTRLPLAEPPTPEWCSHTMRASQSGAYGSIALCRDAPRSFDDAERSLAALAIPHLLSSWRQCQQFTLLQHCAAEGRRACALVDYQGHIQQANGAFYTLLRGSWQDWAGDRIPGELVAAVGSNATRNLRNARWMFTRREHSVAAAVTRGLSYQETASHLNISSNTVRNALTRAYAKLGVRNKLEMALRFKPVLMGE
jgi:DNA-binding CsgD family transcriptional regulator